MAELKLYDVLNDTANSKVNLGRLDVEISESGNVNNYAGLSLNGNALIVLGNSIANETALDALILAHNDTTLAEYKQNRYNEIDYKTGSLIAPGFTYDSNQFSLSANARDNWNNLKHDKTDFTWPKEVSTIDSNSYSLAEADIESFWLAGKTVVDGHLDSGRILKKQIFDAVDKAAVDLIVDTR